MSELRDHLFLLLNLCRRCPIRYAKHHQNCPALNRCQRSVLHQ
jgi:hypothetical protein